MRWADQEAIGLFTKIKDGVDVTDNYGRLIWNYTNRGQSWRDVQMVGLLTKIRDGVDVADNYGRMFWNYEERGNSWGSRTISGLISQLQAANQLPPAPTNSVLPVVTGNNWEGQTLSTTNGTWTNSPTSYTYQWTADGTNIGAATSSTYVLATGQAEKVVRCVVTAHNAGGTGSATSAPTATVMGSPLTIFGADLIGWWDVSDASSVTQSGGLVSAVADKSGNGHNLVASGTQRPAYDATALLGKPALTFNGSTNVMAAANVAPGAASPISLFMLSEMDNAWTDQHRLGAYVANGDAGDYSTGSVTLFFIDPDHSSLSGGTNGGGGGFTRSTWFTLYALGVQPPLGRQVFRVGSVFDGANNTFYLDNKSATPVASTGSINSPGSIVIGNRADASQPWKGNIGEMVVLKVAPDATQRSKLQAWFVRNWTRILVAEGDSLVHGAVGTPALDDGYVRRFTFNSSPSCFADNISIGGSSLNSDGTTQTCTTRAASGYAARIPSTGKYGKKYIFFCTCSNNIGGPTNNGTTMAASYASYLADRKAEGYDLVGLATIIDRTDAQQNEVARHAFNTAVTAPGWAAANGVDFVADFAADAIMGVDNAPSVNPTYFADQVHPNAAGYARLEPIFTAAINSV